MQQEICCPVERDGPSHEGSQEVRIKDVHQPVDAKLLSLPELDRVLEQHRVLQGGRHRATERTMNRVLQLQVANGLPQVIDDLKALPPGDLLIGGEFKRGHVGWLRLPLNLATSLGVQLTLRVLLRSWSHGHIHDGACRLVVLGQDLDLVDLPRHHAAHCVHSRAPGIDQLLVDVDFRRQGPRVRLQHVDQAEGPGLRVVAHGRGPAGNVGSIRARERRHLLRLQAPIKVVEALLGASHSGDVVVVLELPVRPGVELPVRHVCHAVQLSEAGRCARAGTELREEGGTAQAPGVPFAGVHGGGSEGIASGALGGRRVALPVALVRGKPAGVDVVGEHLVCALTRGGARLEAHLTNASGYGDVGRDGVREGSWLVHDDGLRILHTDGFPQADVHGLQETSVSHSRLQKRGILEVVAVQGLIHEVIAHNAFCAFEGLGHHCPKGLELLLDLLVSEEVAP
mmetsp:Transcript_35580/g.66278  ORF Transcript_35580/g.66278 Transcript_35580/m.66278 type:complete len:456 (+) Transcript_35580:138-1505(+)